MGYWAFDVSGGFGRHIEGKFHNLTEMWEYIKETQYIVDDYDFECWMNRNYSVSEVLDMFKEIRDYQEVVLTLYESYEDDVWSPSNQPSLVEGENYDYNDMFTFMWVDDEGDY